MKKSLIAVGILCGAVILSGSILSRLPKNSAHADNESASTSAVASVSVSNSCSLSADSSTNGNSAHSATLSPGSYTENIGKTTLTISCNDVDGWSLYAVGDSDQVNNNTTSLVFASSDDYYISTGTATSGATSNWAMKLYDGTGTNSDGATGPIVSTYASYAAVPNTNTKVATLDRGTTTSGAVSLKTTYAAYISASQPAGTYEGSVKYTLTHPHTNLVCDDGYENVNGVCTEIVSTLYMQDVEVWGGVYL